jgi:hypothetical protein
MVDIVLKLTGEEVSVSSTPDTVNDTVLFRVFTPTGGDAFIIVRDSANNVIGSMSQPAGFVEIMEKRATDTIEANTVIKCTPVAYK